jgi:hypothetical protein
MLAAGAAFFFIVSEMQKFYSEPIDIQCNEEICALKYRNDRVETIPIEMIPVDEDGTLLFDQVIMVNQ